MRRIGLVPYRRLLVVVEDVDALEVVGQIVNRWLPTMSPGIDVQIVRGGAGAVTAFVSAFPEEAKSCGVVGVLDGDMRSTYSGTPRIIFLPGVGDPMHLAKVVAEREPDALANVLGLDATALAGAIRDSTHANHHDYCATLHANYAYVGGGVSGIRSALAQIWLRSVEDDAKAFADNLASLVHNL